MRLTLRTLMAYRDGVLSPADTEDLHRRIQQSQDAGNLLKRINSVTRLPQILAPPVLGKGLGGDPNSIAEYLDDALQSTQVPELERVCLVSDVQLAELAECHALLSSAINTKVAVPAELRRKAIAMRDPERRAEIQLELGAKKLAQASPADRVIRVDGSHSTSGAHHSPSTGAVPLQVQSPMLASGGESIKPQGLNLESLTLAHDVPEYLVGNTRGGWRVPLAIGALLALLSLLVWQSLGPWDRVVELFGSDMLAQSTDDQSNAAPTDDSATMPLAGPTTGDEGSPPATANNTEPSTDNQIVESNQLPPGLDSNVSDAALAQDESQPPVVAETNATSGGVVDRTTQAVWLPKNRVGQRAVLLSGKDNQWTRIEAGAPIQFQTQLVIPPATRTTLDLPQGVLWTACGPSLLQWIEPDADGVPGLSTSLCRSLIRGGPEGRKVKLSTPVGDFLIELADASSMASIEMAYRAASHGSVLDRRAFKPVLVVVAAEGSVSVQVMNQDPQSPSELLFLSLGDGAAVVGAEKIKKFRLQNIPVWFRTSVERPIDALAAEDLHELLNEPGAIAEGLPQSIANLSSYRKPETAALAVQVALLTGNWQPLVDGFLNSDRLRSHWTQTIDLARQEIAVDPSVADELRKLFVAKQGEVGNLLFELLCGLPEDQLMTDGLSNLVAQLDSPRLDVRVLAIYQLQQLTGKNLGFQPHVPNRASVQQWRRELAMDRLNMVPVPDVIWERIPR